jgi:hypothetical protein
MATIILHVFGNLSQRLVISASHSMFTEVNFWCQRVNMQKHSLGEVHHLEKQKQQEQ